MWSRGSGGVYEAEGFLTFLDCRGVFGETRSGMVSTQGRFRSLEYLRVQA